MNVAQIRQRVQQKIGDTAGVEVTSAAILDWINDGVSEIARRTQQPQATASTTVSVGVSAYSLSLFAADILRLRSVMYDGSVLQGLSMEEADTHLATREATGQGNGKPTHYWIWAEQINLWPKPDNSTGVLKLFYLKRPALVAADSDVPGIPLHLHTDLVDYVLAQALETTGQAPAAERKLSRFDAGTAMAAADADWPQRDSYPHVTISADDAGWW